MITSDDFYAESPDTGGPVRREFIDRLIECAENHAEGCPCRLGGDIEWPAIVIEDAGGYVVTVDRGND